MADQDPFKAISEIQGAGQASASGQVGAAQQGKGEAKGAEQSPQVGKAYEVNFSEEAQEELQGARGAQPQLNTQALTGGQQQQPGLAVQGTSTTSEGFKSNVPAGMSSWVHQQKY